MSDQDTRDQVALKIYRDRTARDRAQVPSGPLHRVRRPQVTERTVTGRYAARLARSGQYDG